MPESTKPTKARRQPTDRKAPRTSPSEQLQTDVLDGPPPGWDLLIPPGQLRAGQRAKLLKIAVSLERDSAALADEQYEVGLDLIARVDTLLEKHFALDRKAYAAWATPDGGGPDVENRIITLFSWYAARLGE